MCGIAGIVSVKKDFKVENQWLRKMTNSLIHRGPDDNGIYISGRVGLGNRRLAIIDLSEAGHMPMSGAEGKVWITYNGEIYNFQELRDGLMAKGYTFRSKSDTEVILQSYIELILPKIIILLRLTSEYITNEILDSFLCNNIIYMLWKL